jgi:hypothetical protein
MSKGDTPRKVDFWKYSESYDKIFGKPIKDLCEKCQNAKEQHYIYGLVCEECDFKHGDDLYNP